MVEDKFPPWPFYDKDELSAVQNVLLSNKVNYWTGTECNSFEKEFARWSGSKYAVALGNGTLALDSALRALEIGNKDEVIVTSRTYIASASSIVNVGATPIFADVNLNSQNIDIHSVSEKISKRTKAIICVHLAGWPCEMDELMNLAKKQGLYVIEDCSQAHGAKYKKISVGSIGDIGCWSFCQDKIISTGGEGGMITTNNKLLWQKIWSYKDHGKDYNLTHKENKNLGFRWLHESFGSNYRMTEIQAAIGRIQLRKIQVWQKKRLENAKSIWEFAKNIEGLRVPDIPEYIEHACYRCYIFLEPEKLKKGWDRDKILEKISALGIPCFSGSCSEVYLERAFINSGLGPKNRLINAKYLGETSIAFLTHPTLRQKDIVKTKNAIGIIMKEAVNIE
jgi:dTDP-4-amino-4,6-dideoxygalactose transaminase